MYFLQSSALVTSRTRRILALQLRVTTCDFTFVYPIKRAPSLNARSGLTTLPDELIALQ